MRNKCEHRHHTGEKYTSSHVWENGICAGPYADVMPTREQIAEAIFNASMPHGLEVTWAKLTDPNVRAQNVRVIDERLKWADAVLALLSVPAQVGQVAALPPDAVPTCEQCLRNRYPVTPNDMLRCPDHKSPGRIAAPQERQHE